MRHLLAGVPNVAAAGAWTPEDFGALLRFWYDASDAASFTYSSGTVVSQWNDLSGNGYHLTEASTFKQPNRNATLNGLSGVTFGGSVLTADAGSNAIDLSPWTFWAVIDLGTSANFDRILTTRESGTSTNDYQSPNCILAFRNSNSGGNYTIASHSAGTPSANASGVSTPMIVGSRMSGSNVYASVNGTETAGTAATAPGNVRYLRIGDIAPSGSNPPGSSNVNPLDGVIYEMFAVNDNVTATDALTYLETKWGL